MLRLAFIPIVCLWWASDFSLGPHWEYPLSDALAFSFIWHFHIYSFLVACLLVCLVIFRWWAFYLNIWLTLVWGNPDGWNSDCALQERICFQNLCWVPRDHLHPLLGAVGAARISLLPLDSHHRKFRLLFYSCSRVGSSALGKPWLSWLSAAPISAFVPLFLSFVCMWHSLGTHVFAWVPKSPYFPATPAVN